MRKWFKLPSVFVRQLSRPRRTIVPHPTSVTAFVGLAPLGPLNQPTRVDSVAKYDLLFGGLSRESTMSYAVRHFFQAGGSDAVVVRIAEGTAAAVQEALDALETGVAFNLLCIPPYSFADGADIEPSTWEAARICCHRCRAFLIVDAPSQWSNANVAANEVDAYRGTFDDHAAMYFPRLTVPDPLANGASIEFAPSGTVAGVYARTDATRGVWKAPAGTEATLTGVSGLASNLDNAALSLLNPLGINALRMLPGRGHVIWGGRTLAGADNRSSEWKYVPVRRLALHIEESVYRGTEWVASEPNGDATWSALRMQIQAFMHNLFRNGALQGRSSDEAYFVRCDRSTMTQVDIDRGIVIVEVGFAALRPAEFLILRISQPAQGAA